jgi:hypothetical protein
MREDVYSIESHDQYGSTELGKFSNVAPNWRRYPATKRSNSELAEAVRFRAATNRMRSFLWNVSDEPRRTVDKEEQ